jgi:hypothetical protein
MLKSKRFIEIPFGIKNNRKRILLNIIKKSISITINTPMFVTIE